MTMKGGYVAESEVAGGAARFEVNPNVGNHFAFIRTRLALERTMMAWVRTAVALIGFGFTIVQFFERFGGMEGVAAAARPVLPRYIGLGAHRHGCGRPVDLRVAIPPDGPLHVE